MSYLLSEILKTDLSDKAIEGKLRDMGDRDWWQRSYAYHQQREKERVSREKPKEEYVDNERS